MSDRKTDNLYLHWSRVIQYESRDLVALQLNSARALADRDVRGNPTLEGMIRAEIDKRRFALEQEANAKRVQDASSNSEMPQPSVALDSVPTTTPEQVQKSLERLSDLLGKAISQGNEDGARDMLARLQSLHKQHPDVVPSETVAEHDEQVRILRDLLLKLRGQVATLEHHAVTAAKRGKAEELEKALRRLTAIHVAQPSVLDESKLESIRNAASDASAERKQDKDTTRKLLERQKTINARIKSFAAVIRDFHEVSRKHPETSEVFRMAEEAYLEAIRKVDAHDAEWFTGIVLEFADVLAEWTVAPRGAAGQIDGFLEHITAGLRSIRSEINEIRKSQDADSNSQSSTSSTD